MKRTVAAALPLAALLVATVSACGSTAQQGATTTSADGLGIVTGAGGVRGDGLSVPSSVATTGAGGVGAVGGVTSSSSTSAIAGTTTPGGTSTGAVGSGTSHTPVSVGFLVEKDLGPATKALGVNGLSTGNGAAQAKATVALINAADGLGGHPIKPLIFQQDATQDQQSQYQAACSYFFDDNKASAVVAWGVLPVVMACAQQHGVPFVTSGNRAPNQATLNEFPAVAVPSQMPLESVISTQVAALSSRGWFRASSATQAVKIGLIYADTPDFTGVPNDVNAALKRIGLSLTDTEAMPSTDDTSRVAGASSAASSAVLKFRSDGINRVLVVDKSGQAIAYFGIAAQNQNYYPLYGISSLELPVLLRTVLSMRQLEGTEGIGFAPMWDLPMRAQPKANANTAACLAAMRKAGEDMGTAATRASALTTCDGALVLADAWKRGVTTSDAFVSGLQAIGRSYQPVMTLSTDFSRGRAPASSYQPMAYGASCDCFKYVGPETGMG